MEVELCRKHGRISGDKPFVVTIPDEIEGDMEFSFKIKNDEFNQSYTKYNVLGDHNAEIVISNVKYNGVKSTKPIMLGTFKEMYYLYVSFVIFNENSNDKTWEIELIFTIKELDNNFH